MKVYLKGTYKLVSNASEIKVRPNSPCKELRIDDILVKVIPDKENFYAFREVDLEEPYIEFLKDAAQNLPVNEGYVQEIKKHLDPLDEVVRKISGYLKYFNLVYFIDDKLIHTVIHEWSLDDQVWNFVVFSREPNWVDTGVYRYTLPNNVLCWHSVLINKNIEPFFAFSHLTKAFTETNTRHQWINATIAAELAFKEFLSRYDPRTSTLMAYVPSPPIKRLYRDVLKDYTG